MREHAQKVPSLQPPVVQPASQVDVIDSPSCENAKFYAMSIGNIAPSLQVAATSLTWIYKWVVVGLVVTALLFVVWAAILFAVLIAVTQELPILSCTCKTFLLNTIARCFLYRFIY